MDMVEMFDARLAGVSSPEAGGALDQSALIRLQSSDCPDIFNETGFYILANHLSSAARGGRWTCGLDSWWQTVHQTMVRAFTLAFASCRFWCSVFRPLSKFCLQ